jgi:hypothetical protein
MRIFYVCVVLLLALTACSKKTPAPAKPVDTTKRVDYEFSAIDSGNYSFMYWDENETPQSINVKGKTWSMKFIRKSHRSKTIGFSVFNVSLSNTSGVASVSVNDTIKTSNQFNLTFSNPTTSAYYNFDE